MIKSTFRKIVHDSRKDVDIINEFAKEKDCRQAIGGQIISTQLDYTEQFVNYCGNIITVAHREHNKSGVIVEFIIENSFKQSQRDQGTRLLTINND